MPITLVSTRWDKSGSVGGLDFYNPATGTSVFTVNTTDVTVTGTFNFDGTVDFDGNVQFDGTVTVGADDTGHDVKFFGATSGQSWLWDESADQMIITGTSQFTGAITIGVNDTGYDVTFYGATASANMLWDESADDLVFSGVAGINLGTGGLARTGRQRLITTEAKIGATAGWTLGGGAVDTGLMGTVAASQTNGTLVVPVPNLKIGDTITAFQVNGQIESAGGAVTLDADLRVMTAVSTGSTDGSVGAITQVSVSADTLVAQEKTGLSQAVAAAEGYYVLLTGTTAASTDIELVNIEVTVTEA